MVTETVKFNHSAGDLYSVFGLTKERALEISGSIIFTEIDKAYTAHKLYDNLQEAPAEFTTKTGVLDAVLGEVENDNEALFATYEWGKHITLSSTQDDYQKMTAMFTMLYMINDGDKDKFLKTFVEQNGNSED